MNPGAAEEVGKAAGIFMGVMKDQPLSLALVVMNVLLLGLFFYVTHLATANRGNELQMIFAAQKEVQQLLYNCSPDKPRG